MRTTGLGMVLLLSLSGCVGEAEDPAVDVPATKPPVAGEPLPAVAPAGAGEITGALRPVGGSSVEGQWKMVPTSNDTRIAVLLTSNDRATYPGHIHSGSCDRIGEAVAPLQPVTTELGPEASNWVTSNVEIPMYTLVKGDHVIVYRADGPTGAPVVCGHVPYEATPDLE